MIVVLNQHNNFQVLPGCSQIKNGRAEYFKGPTKEKWEKRLVFRSMKQMDKG